MLASCIPGGCVPSEQSQIQNTRVNSSSTCQRPSLHHASISRPLLPWKGLDKEERGLERHLCPLRPVPSSAQHQLLEIPWPGLAGSSASGLSSSVVCTCLSLPTFLAGQLELWPLAYEFWARRGCGKRTGAKGISFAFYPLNAFIWFGGHTQGAQGLLPALCCGGHVMLELKSGTPLGKTCILPITLSVQL